MSIYVIGHKSPDTDSICSAIGFAAYQQAKGVDAVAARAGEPNKETSYALDYFKAEAPVFVEKLAEKQGVFMVDHNEIGQAVDGIEGAELLGVVDHHRLGGGLSTAAPLFMHFEAVGCTATLVSNMFWQDGIAIPQQIAGLLLSAVISDTVLFKSPTCTEKDKAAAAKLAEIAGVDLKEYGMAMLKAGAGIDGMTPEDIANTDLKAFKFGEYSAVVSQISVMDPSDVMAIKADLLAAMSANCAAKGVGMALMMVTDIMEESTTLLVAGEPKKLVEIAFGKPVEADAIYLPGVMSRKKQIVPPMTEAAGKV